MREHFSTNLQRWVRCTAKHQCKFKTRERNMLVPNTAEAESSPLTDYFYSRYGQKVNPREVLAFIKRILSEENHGRTNQRVSDAKQIELRQVPLSAIHIGNLHHYERISPRKPDGLGKPVWGVVVEVSPTRFVLVDGYHRTKYAHEQGMSKKALSYIVLR